MADVNVQPPAVRAIVLDFNGTLAQGAKDPPIADHAIAFVCAAAEWVPLAIASGAFRREIERVLDARG